MTGFSFKATGSFLSSSEWNNNFGFFADQFLQERLGLSPDRITTHAPTDWSAAVGINTASSTCLLPSVSSSENTFHVPIAVFATIIDQISGSTLSTGVWTTGGTYAVVTNGYIELTGTDSFAAANGANAIDFKTLTGNSRCIGLVAADAAYDVIVTGSSAQITIGSIAIRSVFSLTFDKTAGKANLFRYDETGGAHTEITAGVDISSLDKWYPKIRRSGASAVVRVEALGYHGKDGGDTTFCQTTAETLTVTAETALIYAGFNLVGYDDSAVLSMSADNGSAYSAMAKRSIREITSPGTQGILKIGQAVNHPVNTGSGGTAVLRRWAYVYGEAP